MNKLDTKEYYTITELTREFDISTRTIRFYEDEGLIKPVRRGRTRLFRPSDRRFLKFILRGKRLGHARVIDVPPVFFGGGKQRRGHQRAVARNQGERFKA